MLKCPRCGKAVETNEVSKGPIALPSNWWCYHVMEGKGKYTTYELASAEGKRISITVPVGTKLANHNNMVIGMTPNGRTFRIGGKADLAAAEAAVERAEKKTPLQ